MTDTKAPLEYWESVWENAPTAAPVELGPSYRNYVGRAFATVLRRAFGAVEPRAQKVIEVGCGNSGWLATMHSHFSVTADGLDYSPSGHARAEALLRKTGGPGRVFLADMFSPPPELLGSYDAAVSFGVVEHFEDTANAVGAIANLVRPGGVVITFVPNFAALMGGLQRVMNREIYDRHVPLDAARLALAQEQAGLKELERGYAPFVNLEVVNHGRQGLIGMLLRGTVAIGNRAGYLLEKTLHPTPRRALAPYAYVTGRVVKVAAP